MAYNPSNALWTTGTITVNPAAVAISRATDYYAIFSAAATGQNATNYSVLLAGAVLVVTPILLLFVFLQRYFIQGVAGTGIK